MKNVTSIACLMLMLFFISCEKEIDPINPNDTVENNITSISWFGDTRNVQTYAGGELELYFSVNTIDGKAPNGKIDIDNFTLYSGGVKTKAMPVECDGLSVVKAEYNQEKQVLEVLVLVDSNATGSGETYLEYKGYMRSDGFGLHVSTLKLEDFKNPDLEMKFKEWFIVDESATTDDFEPLRERLEQMNSSVDILMPNLKAMPKKALSYTNNISSVSLPMATTIGKEAFYNEDFNSLITLSLPMADENSLLDGTIYPEELSKVILVVGDHINVSGKSIVKVQDGKIVNRIGSFNSLTGGTSDSSLTPLYQEIAYDEISEDNYPDGDYWSITGCTTLEKWNNISDALTDACDDGRKISILIEELTTVDDNALRASYPSALNSISLPNATKIGNSAFEFCRNLESAYLPKVVSIGDYAFHCCEALDTLSLPKIETLGVTPFSLTGELAGLELNPNLFSVADGMVYNKDITKIMCAYNVADNYTAPSSVTDVAELSFLFCEELKSASFPSVKTVGDRAFSKCYSLTSLSIPQASVIGDGAFGGCESLDTIEVNPAYFACEDGILYNSDKSTIVKAIKVGDWYVAPSSVTTVAKYAFDGFKELRIVMLPDVVTIESNAFSLCESLSGLSSPKAKILGDGALKGCESLVAVKFQELETVGAEAFSSCYALSEISLPKVTTVGSSAFFYCESLETVILPSAVSIQEEAFWLSKAIVSMEIASAPGVIYSQDTEDWYINYKSDITIITNDINKDKFSSWGFKEVIVKGN